MMRLVLFQPEIAGNVGAAIRAAACFGASVDIVEPCGFPADDKALKRASMDYVALAPPRRHNSWAAYLQSAERQGGRLILLSTKADMPIWEAALTEHDRFVIGRESGGVPPDVRAACDLSVKIPLAEGARSLNAATAAAIALAEARRQSRACGGVD
jgi:tRNA (cytidine/uridine-2'-O-)-methyltransferase